MTDKHTPGPWTVIEKPNVTRVQCGDHLRASISVSYGDTSANIPNYGTKDEARANAALIARAPDLLAENERLRAEIERLQGLIWQATEYVEADPLVMGGTAEHAILLDALQRVNKGA